MTILDEAAKEGSVCAAGEGEWHFGGGACSGKSGGKPPHTTSGRSAWDESFVVR